MKVFFTEESHPPSKSEFHYKKSAIFYFSSLFGIFPLIQRSDFVRKYFSILYSLALIVLVTASEVLRTMKFSHTEKSNTNKLLYAGYSFLNFLLCVTSIITPLINNKYVGSILKGLSKIDTIIRHFEPNFAYKEGYKRLCLQIIFIVGITLFFFVIYTKASEENTFPPFSVIEFYILPITWLIAFQIDYFMAHLRERFVAVNHALEDAMRETHAHQRRTEPASVPAPLNMLVLHRINEAHFSLYKIFSEINKVYSAQLLVMLPRVIFFCILPVHYNIVTALVRNPNDKVSQAWTHTFTLTHILLLVSPVIYAIKVSCNAIDEAKKIYTLIHDLIDEGQDSKVESELLIFSVQMLHRQIDFSVYECFSMKPSLTTAMFQLIITYVIILLQFQDSLASMSPIHLLLRPPIKSLDERALVSTTAMSLTGNLFLFSFLETLATANHTSN